jgi:hypothetical protein
MKMININKASNSLEKNNDNDNDNVNDNEKVKIDILSKIINQKKTYKEKKELLKSNKEKISTEELNKLRYVCKDYMNNMCERENCKFIHDSKLCKRFWRVYSCKYKETCKKNHFVDDKLYEETAKKEKELREKTLIENSKKDEMAKRNEGKHEKNEIEGISSDNNRENKRNENYKITRPRIKNTETFVPLQRPVDMRILYDLGCYHDKLNKKLSTRDVLLVPNLFRDFEEGEIYDKIIDEVKNCGIPEEKIIIPWHGNNVIPGTHMIASDWEKWKRNVPTFNIVINRISDFFDMKVKATRLNWYQDTSQWKAFHFDSAKINPEKSKIQNFTVAVSFGKTRQCAFERDDESKTVISIPIGDGEIYCFAKETNENWRHGVLQELPKVEEGRISIVAWGWVDDIDNI